MIFLRVHRSPYTHPLHFTYCFTGANVSYGHDLPVKASDFEDVARYLQQYCFNSQIPGEVGEPPTKKNINSRSKTMSKDIFDIAKEAIKKANQEGKKYALLALGNRCIVMEFTLDAREEWHLNQPFTLSKEEMTPEKIQELIIYSGKNQPLDPEHIQTLSQIFDTEYVLGHVADNFEKIQEVVAR